MKRIMVIAIGLAAIAVPALAQTSAEQLNAAEYQRMMSGGPPASSTPPPMPAADGCPPGTHWEEAGYVKHSKWRPAHCARN